jgi:hypothetical protein
MSAHLTPSQVCERLFGGPEAVAVAAGLHFKSAFRWRRGSDIRDAGDLPSARVMCQLLVHAAAQGIPLRAEHVIWGASAAEIEALAASPVERAA